MTVDARETQRQARFLDVIITMFVHTEETLHLLSSVISPTLFSKKTDVVLCLRPYYKTGLYKTQILSVLLSVLFI
jgi:hypothetical protein